MDPLPQLHCLQRFHYQARRARTTRSKAGSTDGRARMGASCDGPWTVIWSELGDQDWYTEAPLRPLLLHGPTVRT